MDFRNEPPAGGAAGAVPCIGCGVCMSRCPMELDIPKLLRIYNQYVCTVGFVPPEVLREIPEGRGPDACLRCRCCERTCPRRIRISGVLADLAANSRG